MPSDDICIAKQRILLLSRPACTPFKDEQPLIMLYRKAEAGPCHEQEQLSIRWPLSHRNADRIYHWRVADALS